MKASGVRNILVFFVVVLIGTASMYVLSGPGAKLFKASIILEDTLEVQPEIVPQPEEVFITPEIVSKAIDGNMVLNDDGIIQE